VACLAGATRSKSGRTTWHPKPLGVVAEKLPYESLRPVQNALRKLKEKGVKTTGVYIAHDSMGTPRYIGRGAIFPRLRARKNQNRLELKYYSFYVVPNPSHEREVETLMIRAAGPLLEFNERKKRVTLDAGSIHDYMAGTLFFQRRRARAVKRRRRSRRRAV
jgi:hypothetical protein